ncbi:DUF6518 family protein [Dactylosporangium sucinum]|uniref:Uncharacterized protein n=1 Tax=Dactylosporangium sucinum TaxID=1424081 RepID=A0A917WU70_9ACTN|nr:DUF6518 family protein [Dactylosporangium sucinum]GGM29999.1 hypothetical protein GCM10007977_034080 [Dactylosporangium sucinum]
MRFGWPVLAGVALGVASVAADRVGGALRTTLQFLASTGFSWGCVGFVVALPARTRGAAVAASVVALCTATACYYWLNLGGGPPAGVLLAFGYWLALSVAGGAALGALAHAIRRDHPHRAAIAAGIAGGLLAGAGIQIAVVDPGPAQLMNGGLQAVAGLLVVAWLFARRPAPRPWLRYAGATVLAGTVAALAWDAVESVQVVGF